MCLCTGDGVCLGLLAAGSSLPRFAIFWDSIPCDTEHGRGQQSRGDLTPASPSLLIHSLQLLEGHKPHLGSLYLGISCCCGLVCFFTLPIFCVSMRVPRIELKCRIPPRQWSCCRCGYVGRRLSVGKSAANVCSSELMLPRRFGPHPALHLCLSKKPEALNSTLQVRVLPSDFRASSSVGTSQGSCTEGSPDEQIFS